MHYAVPWFAVVLMALLFWWLIGWQIVYGEPIVVEESRALVDKAAPGDPLQIYMRYKVTTNCPPGAIEWRLITRERKITTLPDYTQIPTIASDGGLVHVVRLNPKVEPGPAILSFIGMWRCTPLRDFVYQIEFPVLIDSK